MCGIAFYLNKGGSTHRARITQIGKNLTRSLAHRGPDNSSFWVDPNENLILAHTRLAVIDPLARSNQPFVSPDGRYVMIFNGEIYNHNERREELNKKWDWKTSSDTETLLAMLILLGPKKALPKLTGMFAFCFYDRYQMILIVGRDVFGEKPMYYGVGRKSAFLASDLAAFDAMPQVQLEINREAAAQFVQYGYIPEPQTIYQNILKLPPGHFATLKVDNATLDFNLKNYDQTGSVAVDKSIEVNTRTLSTMLDHSISQASIADVPLGVFLSGGIDSSIVAAILAQKKSQELRTFTVRFPNEGFDESKKASGIADFFGTNHTTIDLTQQEFLDAVEALPHQFSEPFADPSSIPTMIMCQRTQQHLKVALTGDGGDELFMGYNRHFKGISLWKRLNKLPEPMRLMLLMLLQGRLGHLVQQSIKTSIKMLPEAGKQNNISYKIKKAQHMLGANDTDELFQRLILSGPSRKQPIKGYAGTGIVPKNIDASLDIGQAFALLDQKNYLPSNVLVKSDRCGMANGLEIRAPLLSSSVRDFANSLPISQKVHKGQGKYILKKVLKQHVPEKLYQFPKSGFDVPIETWMRRDLNELINDTLSLTNLDMHGLLEPKIVEDELIGFNKGKTESVQWIWNVFNLQRWKEEWR